MAYEAVGLTDFAADNQRAEASYRDSTSSMTDGSIKLALAQDRLRRSVEKGPAAWREQARAELAVRNAEQDLRRETDALAAAQSRQTRTSTGMRGSLASLTGGMAGLRGGVGALTLGFLGAGGLSYAMVETLGSASDLSEEISKARVTFGASARDVERYAQTTSRSFGISRTEALAYASTLGGILKASELTRAEAARLGVEFVSLGGDMASFNNASPAETLEAIRSGLVGEYEPLRRYQVLLSEARVSQEALRLSGKSSKAELTEREKVLARVNLIMAQTVDQQGDAARTGGNYAGQVRRLNAQLRDLKTSAGTLALPVVTDLVSQLNAGATAANRFARALNGLGNISVPGSDSGFGRFLKEAWDISQSFPNPGQPSSYLRFLERFQELYGGDDDPDAPGGRAPHGRGGSVRGPALRRQQQAALRRRNRRTIVDVLLDEARAEATPGTGDDVRFKDERRDRIQRRIDELERRKKLSVKQKQDLARLYNELAAVNSEIEAISDRAESEASQRREEAERRREERRRRQAERLDRILDAAERTAAERGKLLSGTGGSVENMRRQALRGVPGVLNALEKGSDAKPVTAAELRRILMDMLKQTNAMREFGSNFADSAAERTATHASAQTDILSEMSRQQGMLVRGQWHPGAWYAGNELAVAGTGTGF